MAAKDNLTTTLSTKGQVILPTEIRRPRRWDAGTRLVVVDTPDGVLLKSTPLFQPTRPDEVFGCLPHQGRPKSIDEMNAGVQAEIRRRHDRGRY